MIRIAGFDYLDMDSTDGVALTLYAQGCRHQCKGCHNKELWDFFGGTEYDDLDLVDKVIQEFDRGDYDYVVLLGGDFLCQDADDVRFFMRKLYEHGIKVWLYTGYDYSDVPEFVKINCYCIKAGAYDPVNYPPKEGSKLASSNQAYYFANGRIEQ